MAVPSWPNPIPYLRQAVLGRICIAETELHHQNRIAIAAERRREVLDALGAALSAAVDLEALIGIMGSELPRLEIPSCYLGLYAHPEDPQAGLHLRMAYRGGQPAPLPADGRMIPTAQLVPDDLLPTGHAYTLVVEPLFFRERQLGIVVFEPGSCDPYLFEVLQQQISSAVNRMQVEQTFREHETVFRVMAESAPISIFLLDSGGAFTYANPVQRRLSGLTEIEAWLSTTLSPDRERVLSTWHTALQAGKPFNDSVHFAASTGETVCLDLRAAPIEIDGEIIGYVGTAQDISEQIQHEQRRSQQRLAEHLAEQSQKLIGLYNLILIGSKVNTAAALLNEALDQIRNGVSCDAVGFYRLGSAFLKLQAHSGLSASTAQTIKKLPTGWTAPFPDVYASVDTSRDSLLPADVAQAGFGAGMWKWVKFASASPALLGVFWRTPRSFAVEEIALFSGTADILKVILENARLRQASSDTAIHQERRRLSRELHDSVTQSLHSLVISAETARESAAIHPEYLDKNLLHMVASARQALKEMRLLLYELRLASPLENGIVEGLRTRLDAVEHRAGIDGQVVVDASSDWLLEWELELFPIAMEALNNALKYARASRVEVRLRTAGKQFTLSISDNGCGFDPADHTAGIGLSNIKDRVDHLHGRLQIDTGPNCGTIITVTIEMP